MKCNTCGRELLNENANFCEYCGASFRERAQTVINTEQREPEGMVSATPVVMSLPRPDGVAQTPSRPTEIEKSLTFANWITTYGLMFIPIVGGLIFFVMLFVWAFDGKTPPSKKNWARATLIFVAVLIFFFLAYMLYLFSTPMYQDIYQDMLNTAMKYNNY